MTEKIFAVSEEIKKEAIISEAEFKEMYKLSINSPEEFWSSQAKKYLDWFSGWDKVCSADLTKGEVKWFEGAKLNAAYNCIDRHLDSKANETAIIWEGDNPEEERKITFK